MLPAVHEKKLDEIEMNIHKDEVDREMDRLRRRERAKREEERERRNDGHLVKHVEEYKMAFKGDFEKLDDEIKV